MVSAIVKCSSVRLPRGAANFAVAPGNGVDFQSVDRLAAVRDHIDHGKQGARSIQRRAWPAHDFDALDTFQIQGEFSSERGRAEKVIINRALFS